MNPVYSSISTDQPTVLIPFYFCQKNEKGKKKRGGSRGRRRITLNKGGRAKRKGDCGNEKLTGKHCCSSDPYFNSAHEFEELKRLTTAIACLIAVCSPEQ